jgi:hypothetical protein
MRKPVCQAYSTGNTYAVSADGRYLALYELGERNRAIVVELASGKIAKSCIALPPLKDLEVADMEFSRDCKFLAISQDDGTILIWDFDPASTRNQFRGPQNLKEMGEALRGTNAMKAFKAVGFALRHPEESVAYFREQYRPSPKIEIAQAEEYLKQLGDNRYGKRQAAYKELSRIAPLVPDWFDAVCRRKHDNDIHDWLKRIREEPLLPSRDVSELFAWRMVECLEKMGSGEAKKFLRELAEQVDWAGLAARMAIERINN